jgi:hypothetical protein
MSRAHLTFSIEHLIKDYKFALKKVPINSLPHHVMRCFAYRCRALRMLHLKPGSAVAAQITDEVNDINQKRHCVHSY